MRLFAYAGIPRPSAMSPLAYARDGDEKQYALTRKTPTGTGLELSGLREGQWLRLTVKVRNGRVIDVATPDSPPGKE